MRFLLLFFILLLSTPARAAEPTRLTAEQVLPAVIDDIEVRLGGGLWNTSTFVVMRELPWRTGQTVNIHDWSVGLRRLWNTQIFTSVNGWLEKRNGKLVAVFDIRERWSLVPAFELQHGGRATWFLAGLSDHNFLGRYVQLDTVYEYFDGQHGGHVIYRDPRFLDQRLELRLHGARAMRPRPDFVVQRALARVGLHKLIHDDTVRYGATLHAFDDGFLQPIEQGAFNPNLPPHMQTFGIEPSIRYGRVDVRRIQYDGATFEARPHFHTTIHDGARPYGGILTEALAFKALWRFTLALRLRGVAQTRTAEAQLDYWLGGLDTIRGYRDNYRRASVYGLANAEVRFIAFDTDLLACELAVFADVSASRSPDGLRSGTFSFGPGIRFFIPKLVASELRIDFPFAMIDGRLRGDISIGTEPFF